MRKLVLLSVLAVLLLAVLACGGSPTPVVVNPPTGGGGGGGGGSATIIMHNNSGQTVWYAYVSPCSESTWGDDDLGASTVENGSTFTFNVTAGCYDLRADDSDHNQIDVEWSVNVSGTYDWYVP